MIASLVDELVSPDTQVVPLTKALQLMGMERRVGEQLLAYGAFPVEVIPNWNDSSMQFVRASSLRSFLLDQVEFAMPDPAPVEDWAVEIRRAYLSGIYFIQSVLGGPVKIGKADEILYRLKSIQAMNPFDLVVIGIIPVGIGDGPLHHAEYKAHSALKRYRLRLEWFRPHEDVLSYPAQHGVVVGHTIQDVVAEALRAPAPEKKYRRRAA